MFEVTEVSGQTNYKLTTTVMLWLQTKRADSGVLNLGGSLTRQFERSVNSEESEHIIEIGKLVEDIENKVSLLNHFNSKLYRYFSINNGI